MSRLEVICGPMFSGKTEELLRRLRREEIAGRKVVLIKPLIDIRYRNGYVTAHSGNEFPAVSIASSDELHDVSKEADVIGIDEGQFFDDMLGVYIAAELDENKKIIVCGLDKDFATQPFGPMPALMVMADTLDKLTSICNKCGNEYGSFTQRLVDGKPAAFDGPTILVGGTESYESRCRSCFEVG